MLFQQALASMAGLVLPVVAPEISAELGIPASLIGIYSVCLYGISFFVSLGCGGYIQRYGPLRMSQVALFCLGTGLVVSALGMIWLVPLGAMFLGVGAAVSTPCSTDILARFSPPKQAPLVFSIKQTGVPVGGIMAGLLVPYLALQFGWRGAFLGTGLLCWAFAVILQPLRATYDTERRAGYGFSLRAVWQMFRRVLGEPKYRELAMTLWAFVGVQALFGAFFVTFLVQGLDYDLAVAGQIFAGAQAVSIIARVFWGWLSSRLVTPRTMLIAFGLVIAGSSVATGLFTKDWSAAAVTAVAIVYAASAISFHGVLISEIARLAPSHEIGPISGGVLSFAMMGMMTYPAVFGLLLQVTDSYFPGFLIAALPAVLVSINLYRRR